MDDPVPDPENVAGREQEQPPASGGCRVQSVTCGRCGWPSACVAQDGMRVLSFVCHWCGKQAFGVVDPTIQRMVIF
ncbi:MAG: hypothetical protein ACREN2_09605 [Candidatus Dormibacteria bacterium]